jgi:hypothetical protein
MLVRDSSDLVGACSYRSVFMPKAHLTVPHELEPPTRILPFITPHAAKVQPCPILSVPQPPPSLGAIPVSDWNDVALSVPHGPVVDVFRLVDITDDDGAVWDTQGHVVPVRYWNGPEPRGHSSI